MSPTNDRRPLLLLGTVVLLTACGGGCMKAREGTAPAATETQGEPPPSAPAGAADTESMEERAVEEGAPEMDEAAPAPAVAPAPPAESKKEKAGTARPAARAPTPLMQRLFGEVRAFDDALQPERLSCDGARPHVESICDLAARICRMNDERPSSSAQNDCSEAQESCRSARERFHRSCS